MTHLLSWQGFAGSTQFVAVLIGMFQPLLALRRPSVPSKERGIPHGLWPPGPHPLHAAPCIECITLFVIRTQQSKQM